jgi:hypothetical protein
LKKIDNPSLSFLNVRLMTSGISLSVSETT